MSDHPKLAMDLDDAIRRVIEIRNASTCLEDSIALSCVLIALANLRTRFNRRCAHPCQTRFVGCGGRSYWICDECEQPVRQGDPPTEDEIARVFGPPAGFSTEARCCMHRVGGEHADSCPTRKNRILAGQRWQPRDGEEHLRYQGLFDPPGRMTLLTEELMREAARHLGPGNVIQWQRDRGVDVHDLLLWALEARALIRNWAEFPDVYTQETMARIANLLRGEVPRR